MKKFLKLETAGISPVGKPFGTVVSVPGSKSYCQRALLIKALCKEDFEIKNMLNSDDTRTMQENIAAVKAQQNELKINESGLAARFITALAAVSPGQQVISGTPGLEKRPIKDLVDALRELGANIEYMGEEGFLPIKVISSELAGGEVKLKGDISSQYLSALLLIAPALRNGLEIEIIGKQISKPYVDMTIDIMSYFGVEVENQNYKKYAVKPQKYLARDYTVEGDYSSASYFFAMAALNESKITVRNLNPESKQADIQFLEILKKMGSEIKAGQNEITVIGNGVKPVQVNMEDCPDQAMTVAVLAAFAKGKTTIVGIKSLRVKETERIKALENELAKMGIKTQSTEDSLTVYGDSPSGAMIDTYGDHRIAMSFAVAGTKINGIEVINPKVVNKTFPGFWNELDKITKINTREKEYSNILLIGMRGSGKTTVGKLLAEKLGKKFVDIDMHMEEKHSKKKIRDIVLEEGWEHFRKLETEACKEISKEENTVISSGGGIVLDQSNMKFFENNSISILLRAEPAILSTRIRTDANRPELTAQPTLLGELDEVWQKRKDKYYANADFIIDTSSGEPSGIAKEILKKLGTFEQKTCMVIGHPVSHSLSPILHNAGYKKLGITNEYTYIAKDVRPDELESFIKSLKSSEIRGVSVTRPHKEAVMPLLDEITSEAKKIGAVNTIVVEDGKLTGHNTDWIGAVSSLKKTTDLKDKKVTIIGAGGTAKAFAYGLSREDCKVTILNRTEEKARLLANKYGFEHGSLDNEAAVSGADIICNTTVAKSPIDTGLINPNQIIFDVVYSSGTMLKTELLIEAEKKGAKVIPAIEMLLYQGFAQFKLFTGKDAPEDYIRDIIMQKVLNER